MHHADVSAPVVGPRSAPPGTAPKVWNIALWVVQVLLAIVFGMAGFMKSTQPIAALAERMVWPGDVPALFVRYIGLVELAGALGVIFPAAMRMKPLLTPLAAAGFTTIMLLATIFHSVRGEFSALPTTFILGGLAVFVAWGRWKKAPIASR
jgi:uncharacterized membrane protein YphA (DoxX/SURF4 family)